MEINKKAFMIDAEQSDKQSIYPVTLASVIF